MSTITIVQAGSDNNSLRIIGARVFLSFDGDTATYAWAFTSVPSGSTAVMLDDTTSAPSFDPDLYGSYEGTLTDSFANIWNFAMDCPAPMESEQVVATHPINGYATYLPAHIGIDGRRLLIRGQNTDGSHFGGALELAAGYGGIGTRGVILSGTPAGANEFDTNPIAMFRDNGGLQGEMVHYGGSNRIFITNLGDCLRWQAVGNAFTQFLFDAGQNYKLRVNANTQIEANDGELGFYGVTPVAQATRPGQLTDSTGGAVDGMLVDVTTDGLADPGKVNDNFADQADRINKIEAALSAIGILST